MWAPLPILLVLTVGLMRATLWSREVRFYAIGVVVLLLYAVGTHTPTFGIFFKYVPGVSYFRRPIDAVFLVGALLAVTAGYLTHLWLTAGLPSATYRKRALEIALVAAILFVALATAWSVGRTALALKPLMTAAAWIAACSLVLAMPAAWLSQSRRFAMVLPALVLASDLASLNNGPNELTALPPSSYEVLKPNCRNDTVRFLKSQFAARMDRRGETKSSWSAWGSNGRTRPSCMASKGPSATTRSASAMSRTQPAPGTILRARTRRRSLRCSPPTHP